MNPLAAQSNVIRFAAYPGLACGCGMMTAYQYAWLRAQALAAQEAWRRFDVRTN